ncbi:LytR/AlgR family response regulator transcription factor [Acutalibacter caecimuris]|uniref:LytR/AlgR family response regulator transcription factor n=1 Tax=Acutalibacter caecimuris TaxID=3093657 RepID=UPI002AC9AB28|nr:LytTR family DNA-binding domain-containing protein [Acutalibacter sp. M00118]
MIMFAICDDEPQMAREIADQLAGYMKETDCDYSVDCFSSGHALLKSSDEFDVIFLDIQMERPDGMETAALLRRRESRSLLIFVTVLKDRVFDVFPLEAFDYLLKPLDRDRFRRTMDRALRWLERDAAKNLVIQRGSGCQVVPLSDILYCEVLGRKIFIHKKDGIVLDYYDRLEDLEQRVDSRFFKCHRSYLVNLDHVGGCQEGQVLLSQGERIPVSRLRERELTQALLRHMKERCV